MKRSLAAVVAALLVVLVGVPLLASGGTTAAPATADPSTGRAQSCVMDAGSGCTVTHGFGVKPTAVLSGNVGSTHVSIDPAATTATTFRIEFRRLNGTRYAAGTRARFYVHYDFAPAPTPTPIPTPSLPPPPPTPSPTPSPTPTDTASPVKSCTDPGFTTTSTDNIGDGRTYLDRDNPGKDYFVHNNMWNNHSGSGPEGTYTMSVCNYDNWFELVTQAPSTVSPGAVRAYPNVHRDYDDKPLSQIQSARFAGNGPHCAGCIWNIAFDVWINDGFTNELMIWTENLGQRPAGTRLADTTIGGKQYQVWKSGGATTPGGIFTYVSVTPQLHGTMPLQLFFQDLQARGWLKRPAGQTVDTTWQVDYGVEVVSTGGTQQRFNFTDFDIQETG